MERETSSMVTMGVVLIILAALIAIGFHVFSTAKGTASDGETTVNENVQAVGNSVYSSYDQKVVTGTQVLSAYENFKGKPIAIVITTTAASGTPTNYNAKLKDVSSDKTVNGYYTTTSGFATTDNEVEYNYNTAALYKAGNSEYVPSTSRFNAYLIKDSTGSDVLGINFVQVNNG